VKEQLIQRYSAPERINHWVVAVCFVLLAISGLAFFYPAFFWLTGVFGTPQLARIVHPFVGVVMFLAFARQFFRYWHHNLITPEDVKWMKSVKEVMKGNEVGDIGKYNGGQKGMFWLKGALHGGAAGVRPDCLAAVLCRVFPDSGGAPGLAGARQRRRGADCRHHRPRLRRAVGERHHPRHGGRRGHPCLGKKTPSALVS